MSWLFHLCIFLWFRVSAMSACQMIHFTALGIHDSLSMWHSESRFITCASCLRECRLFCSLSVCLKVFFSNTNAPASSTFLIGADEVLRIEFGWITNVSILILSIYLRQSSNTRWTRFRHQNLSPTSSAQQIIDVFVPNNKPHSVLSLCSKCLEATAADHVVSCDYKQHTVCCAHLAVKRVIQCCCSLSLE